MSNQGGIARSQNERMPEPGFGPRSARSCLVVLLMFHGLIISQIALVLVRLTPALAENRAKEAGMLPSNSEFLVTLSEWILENPYSSVSLLVGFILTDAALFLATWRLMPKSAMTWWMRGTVVAGGLLLGWLYLSLYLTSFALRAA